MIKNSYSLLVKSKIFFGIKVNLILFIKQNKQKTVFNNFGIEYHHNSTRLPPSDTEFDEKHVD